MRKVCTTLLLQDGQVTQINKAGIGEILKMENITGDCPNQSVDYAVENFT